MPNKIYNKSQLKELYERLTPICPGRSSGWWYFNCSCGKICLKRLYLVTGGHTRSCGCLHKECISKIKTKHGLCNKIDCYSGWLQMRKICRDKNIEFYESWNDLTIFAKDVGKKPGNNYVIRIIDKTKGCIPGNCEWIYKKSYNKSDGSNIRKDNLKEYCSWEHMKKRCSSLEEGGDHLYFLNGIKVCQRWLDSFENFLEDMGKRPTINHTLHRKDGKLGYFKENCEWATKRKQVIEKSNTVFITYKNLTLCKTEWAEILGISVTSLTKRLKKLTIEQAFTKPLQNGKLLRTPEQYLKEYNDRIKELYPDVEF